MTASTTCTTSGQTDTTGGRTSTTSEQTITTSGKTSTTSGKVSTTNEKTSIKSTTSSQTNTTNNQTSSGEFGEKGYLVIISCLMVEPEITIYFLKMSFRKSLFAITALAYSAKTFVIFTCTFGKVREDIHK